MAFKMLKDADGRLGLGFANGAASLARDQQGAVITDVMPKYEAFKAGLRNGDLLVSVDGKLVTDQKSGVRLLTAAKRALTGVVWRPRVEADRDAERAEREKQRANVGKNPDDDLAIGSVPWAYYSHDLYNLANNPLPPSVALYEDLTM